MSKRLKLSSEFMSQKHSESNHSSEDRISELPDEILVTILSRVTMREAGQTSILSRRWKNLWTFTTGSLDFDASDVLFKIGRELDLAMREQEKHKYSIWVNQILKSHKGASIDGFRVRFDLDNTHKSNIDSWINFALQKRARKIEVDLKRLFTNLVKDCYPFPKQVLGFSNIKFLRALRLNNVDVRGQVLEDLLSKCPSLEALSVSSSTSLVGLKVCGASLKLKFIEIQHCYHLEYIEVSAGNLMALTYAGPDISLRINHAPKLYVIYLGGFYCKYKFPMFCELSSFFSQIETLVLDCDLDLFRCIPEFPKFKILKHLELRLSTTDDNSLLSCISLIKACPMLNRLAVHFEWWSICPRPRKVEKRDGDQLQCLKVVEFRCFAGRTTDVELAVSLLESAPHLEKIIINTSLYDVDSPLRFVVDEPRRAARECARQLARKHSPQAKLCVI